MTREIQLLLISVRYFLNIFLSKLQASNKYKISIVSYKVVIVLSLSLCAVVCGKTFPTISREKPLANETSTVILICCTQLAR